jgi:exonuclease SbcC
VKADDALEAQALETMEPSHPGEGFVLEEIEMRGFMRYLERTDPPLRFPEKFTVITGRTGAGKSSILDAITFALYGATARTDIQSVKISDVCRPGGYVRLAFRQGDARWDVKRGFTTKKESYLEVARDGEAIAGTIHDKEATIRDVVGLDYVAFRNSTFVRQEEMKELGSARGADRLAVFQKLFRLEVFERALEIAKEQQSTLARDLLARDAAIAAHAEKLLQVPEMRGVLEAAKADIAARQGKVAALEGSARDADAALRRLEATHDDWVRARSALEDRAARLAAIGRREAALLEQRTALAALEAERSALEASVKDLEDIRAELETLKDRQSQRGQREQAVDAATRMFDQAKRDHERRRDQIKDKIDALFAKVAALKTDVDRDAAFELLRDEGRLEERVARIGRELEWLAGRADLVDTLGEERGRAEKALERVRAKVASVDQDSFVLTEFQAQLEGLKDDLRREVEESHATLKPLDEAKIEALRQLDAAPFTDMDRRRAEDLARSVREKADQRKALDGLHAKARAIGDVAALLAELAKDRTSVTAERARFEADVARLEPAEAAYQEGRKGLESSRASLDGERKVLHTLEGQASALAAQIAALEADEVRLREAERERDELKARAELFDLLVARVFHKKGVVMYAVDQLLPTLEIEASRNLAELTDGRFSGIKLETYEEGRGHGIRIRVRGVDREWHDVGEFSGGEKTQINAALRFAIAKELASLPQAGRAYGRMKTLFIDEGDLGSLDTEVSRELFVQKLFRMGEFFEKVILITHLAEVADKFPGRIRVTMTPEQESRVDVVA